MNYITDLDDDSEKIIKAIKYGYNDLAKELGWNYEERRHLNSFLLESIKTNNKELISFFLYKGANCFNDALVEATRINNKDLIWELINRGADDYESALIEATEVNNRELIDFFIAKGAMIWS